MTENFPGVVAAHDIATVHYLSGDLEVLSAGTYVLCAVTRQPIHLEHLRYWNADLQEAYATPEIAAARHRELFRSGG